MRGSFTAQSSADAQQQLIASLENAAGVQKVSVAAGQLTLVVQIAHKDGVEAQLNASGIVELAMENA